MPKSPLTSFYQRIELLIWTILYAKTQKAHQKGRSDTQINFSGNSSAIQLKYALPRYFSLRLNAICFKEKENNFASKLSVVFFLFEAHGWTVTNIIQQLLAQKNQIWYNILDCGSMFIRDHWKVHLSRMKWIFQ